MDEVISLLYVSENSLELPAESGCFASDIWKAVNAVNPIAVAEATLANLFIIRISSPVRFSFHYVLYR